MGWLSCTFSYPEQITLNTRGVVVSYDVLNEKKVALVAFE